MTTQNETDDWPVDFDSLRLEQLRGWMAATPEQKLQWLEDAQKLAYTAERIRRDTDGTR